MVTGEDGGWEAVVEESCDAFMVFDTKDDVTAFLNAMRVAEADVKSDRRSPTKSAGTRATS